MMAAGLPEFAKRTRTANESSSSDGMHHMSGVVNLSDISSKRKR